MAVSKTDTKVIIDGKVYTLSGYESEEYLQKVANYLNSKLSDFAKNEGWIKLNTDYRNILMQINIADDFFQAQKEAADLRDELAGKDKDLYSLKHELIATQMKLETTEKNLKTARSENDESAKKIIRLETQLKTREEDAQRRGQV